MSLWDLQILHSVFIHMWHSSPTFFGSRPQWHLNLLNRSLVSSDPENSMFFFVWLFVCFFTFFNQVIRLKKWRKAHWNIVTEVSCDNKIVKTWCKFIKGSHKPQGLSKCCHCDPSGPHPALKESAFWSQQHPTQPTSSWQSLSSIKEESRSKTKTLRLCFVVFLLQ